MQDTSTQAMTEVALGLSMAFFALMILALISVSLPSDIDDSALAAAPQIPSEQQIKFELSQETPANTRTANAISQKQIIVLYWQGQYFDLEHKKVNTQTIDKNTPLIVAVSQTSNLNELIAIQAAFVGHDIRLTKLSSEWEAALIKGGSIL